VGGLWLLSVDVGVWQLCCGSEHVQCVLMQVAHVPTVQPSTQFPAGHQLTYPCMNMWSILSVILVCEPTPHKQMIQFWIHFWQSLRAWRSRLYQDNAVPFSWMQIHITRNRTPFRMVKLHQWCKLTSSTLSVVLSTEFQYLRPYMPSRQAISELCIYSSSALKQSLIIN
jgi:hypothetical protein